jgi:hypothetical protein
MGRVARYKKIKSSLVTKGPLEDVGIWGLGDNGRKAKKRSRTSEKLRAQRKKRKTVNEEKDLFDAPPEDGDDFDLADLVGSLKAPKKRPSDEPIHKIIEPKKAAPPTILMPPSSTNTPFAETTQDKEEKLFNRQLKLEQQVAKKEDTSHQGRMEGESKRGYQKRMIKETRQIIKQTRQEEHNPEKRIRKKEFLKNKKQKKKGGNKFTADTIGARHGQQDSDDDDMISGERAKAAQPRFGEQAERPPTFQKLPRGAKVTTNKATMDTNKSTRMDNQAIEAEQQAMAKLRLQVQAQYAVIRARRKEAGN